LPNIREDIFGYAQPELVGRRIAMLLEKDDDFSELLSVDGTAAPSDASAKEIVGRRKDGTSAWFEVSSAHWKADGRNFVTTIWRDVNERRAADEALRESEGRHRALSEELETRVVERTREREMALGQLHESQKMETIGQLTGGVAHDFNNLLAVILGSLSLLKKAAPSSPRVTQLIDSAIQGAERGATLTKRLLAFARRQELTLEVVDIRQLVPHMLDFLRQSLGPSINIQIDIPAELSSVCVDANQLELALMNLAVNARDAMPAGGTLTISCADESRDRYALPTTLPPGDFVRLSVADTGEGMTDETLAKAMEPFFTTKGVGKGTGLGLSMVHGLAAQTGGATHIASKLGQGTVVTLWLPHAKADSAKADSSEPGPAAVSSFGAALTILLVDDDPLISMNTAYMLMDLGHTVYEASSAMQALKLFEANNDIHVVVTDYAMPNMSGLDLAKRLRALKPELPIILASGYAELPPGQEVAMARLNKPYTQQQLGESLLSVMAAFSGRQ
jgi:PAS domain S-box-containing protein